MGDDSLVRACTLCPKCGDPLATLELDEEEQRRAMGMARRICGSQGVVKGNVDAVAVHYCMVDPKLIKVRRFERPGGRVI
jgi:hypothetical protein